MLLSASIERSRYQGIATLLGGLDRVLDHVAIGVEPVGLLNELAVMDAEYLHPAAALMICRGDLQRRDKAAPREGLHLFHAGLDLLGRRLLAATDLERIGQPLDLDGRLQQAAVIDDRIVHFLRRILAVLLVHRL